MGLIVTVQPVSASHSGVGIHNPDVAVPTTLHLHLVGGDFVVSPQAPTNWTTVPGPAGLQPTVSCVPASAPVQPAAQEQSTVYGHSTAGLVDYTKLENGQPRIRRGGMPDLAYPLSLAGDTLTLHWYLAANPPSASGAGPVPAVAPSVAIQATMRAVNLTGAELPADLETAFAGGELVAQGRSAATNLVPGAPNQSTSVDGRTVYAFTVAMKLERKDIPTGGFALRIDAFVDNPACARPGSGGYLMPNLFAPHSDANHRPHIDSQVTNAVRLEYTHPQFVRDAVVLHIAAQSPFGAAGVQEVPFVEVTGPTTPSSGAVERHAPSDFEYGPRIRTVDHTWVWNYTADNAGSGEYEVLVESFSMDGNVSATAKVAFNIGAGTVTRCTAPDASILQEFPEVEAGCRQQVQDAGVRRETPGLQVAAVAASLVAVALHRTVRCRNRR